MTTPNYACLVDDQELNPVRMQAFTEACAAQHQLNEVSGASPLVNRISMPLLTRLHLANQFVAGGELKWIDTNVAVPTQSSPPNLDQEVALVAEMSERLDSYVKSGDGLGRDPKNILALNLSGDTVRVLVS